MDSQLLNNTVAAQQKRPYTPEEVAYLRENFRTTSYVRMAAHLGRGVSAVQMKCTALGLKRTAKERSQIMSGWSRQPKRAA